MGSGRHSPMRAPARYFPVSAAPLKMAAGLRRFGTDFGQGERDQRYFQLDGERAAYLAAKRAAPPARHALAGDDADAQAARDAGIAWLRDTLRREAPAVLAEVDGDKSARDPLDAIARHVQEDIAILAAGDDYTGRTVALDVRFPSGWRPERLAGASFAGLHAPVPGFLDNEAAARSMVMAMVERGPYVRFVWALSPDAQLDHHPEAVRAAGPVDFQLRVERQVTVPLPHARASVFLIRTYLYPIGGRTAAQQATLLTAVAVMSDEVRAYKGIPDVATLAAALPTAARVAPLV